MPSAVVAPYAGAWIEISRLRRHRNGYPVAPYAGAWIEITIVKGKTTADTSLPTRERGLK